MAEAVWSEVVAACDPARRVREALASPEVAGRIAGRPRYAIAIGKAALAMARGAGPVDGGLCIVPAGGAGDLPAGWRILEGVHPVPDARSVAAGQALRAFMQARSSGDGVLALLSGGASALAELPILPLPDFVAVVQAAMSAGAIIDDLNVLRGALSSIKAGQLALASAAPVVTLAISDVIGDPLMVIGSGPTVGPWLWAPPGTSADDGAAVRRVRARAILTRYQLAIPPILAYDLPPRAVTRTDHAEIVAPMSSAARAAVDALARHQISARFLARPLAGEVSSVAAQLVAEPSPLVAWGEPTLRVPEPHGEGGRAQQLALCLAEALRDTDRSALVIGTDGIDGPPPAERPSPAGAWVDGTTWDAVISAGIDPAEALARCDAGTALAAVNALVVTGPSGINHADLVILG